MILLDTVVLSELRKAKPNAGVLAFLKMQVSETTFLSALTIGEIEAGIAKQRALEKSSETKTSAGFADELAQWLIATELQFANNILPITPTIAKLWGRICVQTGNKGIDNLIAATALCHNLTMVTRNVKDFEQTGVAVINPFTNI
jgi:predicted nucleic acid-binding protein